MNLSGTQLKDTYGNLLTIGTSAGSPQTGTLQNGAGEDITSLTIAGTADATLKLDSNRSDIILVEGDTTNNNSLIRQQSSLLRFDTIANDLTTITRRITLNHGSGDISFRDTSANEAFYWDASTARLGIGTTSPGTDLEVNGDGLTFRLDGTANTARGILLRNVGTATGEIKTDGNLDINIEDAGRTMRFLNGNTPRLVIDSSGNVLVGKTATSGIATGNIEVSNSSSASLQIEGGTHEWSMLVSSSADALRFYQDSDERLRIDSSGNVLVGGTVAGNASTISLNVGNAGVTSGGLQLWGTTTDTHYIQFGDESGTPANHYRGYMAYAHNGDSLRFGTASTERMRIDSSGNVEIGTSSSGKLEIYSSTLNNQLYLVSPDTGQSAINFGGTSAKTKGRISYSDNSDLMYFYTDSQERMRIDSSGTTTITATSGSSLQNATLQLKTTNGSNNAGLMFINTGNTSSFNDIAGIASFVESGDAKGNLRFWTRNSDGDNSDVDERMRITAGGNINILNTTATDSKTIGITNSAGTTGWTFGNGVTANAHQFVIYDNTAGLERLHIDSSGKVGIGTSPAVELDVVGTIRGGIANKKGTYTDGDTTPSVAGISYLRIANTGATTITDFDDAVEGQVIYLEFADSNTTVNRSNAYLSGGTNFTSSEHDMLVLFYSSSTGLWHEISRSVNS